MPGETCLDGGVVLVVDDNPDTLGMLIEALESAGLTALVARSGEQALAVLDRVEPDVVLLDAVMPGMDGFETCRRIKRRAALATTPVLFMTGLSDRAHVAQALRAGGVDYLSKPISPDELIARLAVHVVNARLVADARSAVDASGRGVAAFNQEGAVAWATPRATALLAGALADSAAVERLQSWLMANRGEALTQAAPLTFETALESDIRGSGAGGVQLTVIGRATSNDLLVRVWPATAASPNVTLATALGVSEREAEVLDWLAQGKSNADIALILTLSPRTVTKHVEQIFVKLGVENRTAAAAKAIRVLERY
jgi:DNA-binding NarL/FixJ family response regulator